MYKATPAPKKRLNLRLMSVASALALLAAAHANATTLDRPSPRADEANALGIIGTGSPVKGKTRTQGIIGTGVLGIIGTGSPIAGDVSTQGIIGTGSPIAGDVSTQGIIGTGSRASGKARTKGIIGTGTLGIIGTGVLGVTGSSNPTPSIALFEQWASTLGDSDATLMAYGPVEELSENEILILGQRIEVNDRKLLSKIQIGDSIAVLGKCAYDATAAYRILKVKTRFVEGSTPIYVSATTTSEQESDGSFQMDNVSVFVGSAGANPEAFQVKAGMTVRIAGTKIGEVLVADDLEF